MRAALALIVLLMPSTAAAMRDLPAPPRALEKCASGNFSATPQAAHRNALQLPKGTQEDRPACTAIALGSVLFLQRDPNGYEDSVNLYAGMAWDPINERDPTGMSKGRPRGATVRIPETLEQVMLRTELRSLLEQLPPEQAAQINPDTISATGRRLPPSMLRSRIGLARSQLRANAWASMTPAEREALQPGFWFQNVGSLLGPGRTRGNALPNPRFIVQSDGTAIDRQSARFVGVPGSVGSSQMLDVAGGGAEIATITVRWDSRMPLAEFWRKARDLQELGNRNLLQKAAEGAGQLRDRNVTDDARQDLIARIWEQYAGTNPAFARAAIARLRDRQADHVWELQLAGPDTGDNIRFLDAVTNTEIGLRQIRPQIRALEPGTIIRIRIEGLDQ